jgi:hypothetical protein
MSSSATTGNWLAAIKSHLAADKRKTAALGVLSIVMLVVWGRLFLKSANGAPVAVASLSPALVAEVSASSSDDSNGTGGPHRDEFGNSRRPRLTPVVDIHGADRTLLRDYFSPDWGQFAAAGGNELSAEQSRGATSGVWERLRVSVRRERDRKRREADMVQKQAANLTVQSTIIGNPSSAVVSGRLVHVGEQVEGFAVEEIGPRVVVVRKDGVRTTIRMP